MEKIPLIHADDAKVLEIIGQWIELGQQRYVCFCEANLLANAVINPEVFEILNQADAVLAEDGALMKLAASTGCPLPERLPGPTSILNACEYGLERGWRHFFCGGAEGVAERLHTKLQKKYPGLQVPGTYSPPFRPLNQKKENELAEIIDRTRPDPMWVGLGGPKQEFWMAEHVGQLNVPVMLGVGAAFDFHAGTRPWAPGWIRKAGMEWLWRKGTGGRQTFQRNVNAFL